MFGLSLSAEERLHDRISWSILLSSPLVFVACLWLKAPWGKTTTNKWWARPILPPRISWFVFESPNLLWAWICWKDSPPPNALSSLLLLLFVLHYIQRTIIYPMLMSKSSQRLPLLMAVSAMAYCFINGYLQARSVCLFRPVPNDYIYHPMFWCGIALFVAGAAMNLHSDAILRSLRRSTTTTTSTTTAFASPSGIHRYKIPRGGMFEYVTAPHFLGEILEWTGFALLNQGSVASVSLAVFTAANLVPRALAHHAWYRATFGVSHYGKDNDDDGKRYPGQRKAIIPLLW
ncbi:hypothetical protein MPSEU_000910600 [Mayamaea pseudoterrestris]|nr:hypothetical protein MPSEU_000910600 [Mayamaea pseudoterrestris]